jgi:hypothetical protein
MRHSKGISQQPDVWGGPQWELHMAAVGSVVSILLLLLLLVQSR